MQNKPNTGSKAGWLALCVAVVMAGCGGGGSPDVPSATTSTGTTTTGTGTTTTTTATVTAPTLDVAIYNAGSVSTNIGFGGGYVARATLKNADGTAAAGRTVAFTLPDTSFATLTPASALTNALGLAEVAIVPASITAAGASTLTATATVGTATVTGKTDFSVSTPSLSLSAITPSSTSLASGGNSTLSITALNGSQALTAQSANIAFGTTCGRINGIDTGTTVATNGSGVASVTYSAINGTGILCSGPVTVTATTVGASASSVTLNVAAPTATAVTFVSAAPTQIYVASAGNAEQSILSFKVLSSANTALSGQAVNFTLQQNPAGVTLGQASAITDASGLATVTVSSGTIPGPLKVRAALGANANVFAESQNLTVASGPASQKFMSLSVSKFNLEAATIDGTPSTLTVRIADRQGNAVVDGTVVNFTAEGGQVGSSCVTTTTEKISSCTVNFVSQNPRPTNGRVSVLAYLEGTKDYTDANGNNRYDDGVANLQQLGDAYRDDDENLRYDAVNDGFVFPRNVAGTCAAQTSGSFPSRSGTCDENLVTTVRQMAVLTFASSKPLLTVTSQTSTRLAFLMASGDPGLALLPMPSGTTVATAVIDNTPTNALACALTDFSGSTVVDKAPTPGVPTEDLRTQHQALFSGCASGDAVKVTVTSPSGLATSFIYPVP